MCLENHNDDFLKSGMDSETLLSRVNYEHVILLDKKDEPDRRQVDIFRWKLPLQILPDKSLDDLLSWGIEKFKFAYIDYDNWTLNLEESIAHYVNSDYELSAEDKYYFEDDEAEIIDEDAIDKFRDIIG